MSSRHTHDFELLAALDQPGCSICRLATRSVVEYFGTLGYEQVNDLELREELRAGAGFCHRHAWLFHEVGGNRLGVAIIYHDVLGYLREGLSGGRVVGSRGLGRLLDRLLPGRARARQTSRSAGRVCAACRIEADAESRYRAALLESLASDDARQRYAASDGICLTHLSRAISDNEHVRALAWLREETAQRIDEQRTILAEYIRKHDYRYSRESLEPERDAPRRAVERVVGNDATTPDMKERR